MFRWLRRKSKNELVSKAPDAPLSVVPLPVNRECPEEEVLSVLEGMTREGVIETDIGGAGFYRSERKK